MNAAQLAVSLSLIIVIIFSPRKWATLGMLAGVLYLTQRQAVEVVGFNLFPIRFMEMAGFARVMWRKELRLSELNRMDAVLILLYSYVTVVTLMRGTTAELTISLASEVDALLCYFIFRGLLSDVEDFRWVLRAFVLLLAPYVVLVAMEGLTTHNLFQSLAGVVWEHDFRAGRPRCMGSFRQSITLGTFGASFFPLYIGLLFDRACRIWALVGISLCLGIVWFSNSGAPVTCVAIGLVGWILWALRDKMFAVRRAILAILLLLVVFMKAPIWYLPAKVSDLTGGGGWHRSYLVEQAVNHIGNWWLVGMPISQTAGWFPYDLGATGGADITNMYLGFGLTAGLAAIGLFIFVLILSFRALGRALAAIRDASPISKQSELLLWGLGVALTMHVLNFISVTYFDQLYVVWFMTLAAVSGLSQGNADEDMALDPGDPLYVDEPDVALDGNEEG